ncbi:MAG: NTP transferase domain-containing protein [Lachnospiraceae bacterium]|nr:NTP transferase domain-containing protein [Lachnospiraceae bacterium]
MYNVERAIIMAAGLGNRMRPITDTIPKPLIKINGKPMIEKMIEQLIEEDITDITVVVGYLKEQFDYLKEKYKVNIIINPYYETCNNISSLYVAKNQLDKNVIILDGDQMINNRIATEKPFERSGYNAVWTENRTDEWLMTVQDDNVISCSRTGGEKGWQLFSISRWTKEDGEKLEKYLDVEFIQNQNRQIYWDDVAMFCHFDDFCLGIKEMMDGDVTEVDSIAELVLVDKSYEKYI